MITVEFDHANDSISRSMGISTERELEIKEQITDYIQSDNDGRTTNTLDFIIKNVGDNDAEKVLAIFAFGILHGMSKYFVGGRE